MKYTFLFLQKLKPINKIFTVVNIFLIFLLTLNSCAVRKSVPLGHIPPPRPTTVEEEQLGHEVLAQLTQKYPLDYDHPRRAEVDDVVLSLTDAIGASNHPWHIHVFTDPNVKNAAATKGNHIFIWTGMIDATKNKDELAAILAHEVSHILARHTDPSSQEKWTKGLIEVLAMGAAVGTMVASKGAHGSDMAADLAASLTRAAGMGLFVAPYSRDKEFEADQIGIYLMAKAGYRPEAAIEFWERALDDPSFSASIPFLSTHPPAKDRLERLQGIVLLINKGSGSMSTNYKKPELKRPLPIPGEYETTPSSSPSSSSNEDDDDSFDIRQW